MPDQVTCIGAYLYTNPTFGPCPCDATPDKTRKALEKAHKQLRYALGGER